MAVLVFLWALFFWRFAAPSPAVRWALADGDFTQQFGVFRDLVYRALLAGRAPLWADCLLSGYPIHADPQTQLFYFPSWIAYALLRLGGWGHYPIGALTAEGLAHYLLVSLLLYAFLRGEVRRPTAALFGAVVFTYSGYLTGFPVLQIATIETLAWLPLALLCLRRLAGPRPGRAHRPAYLAGAALALAVSYFGGHPQTFVYVSAVALAYLGFRLRLAGRPWRAWLGWGVGLMILTTGLAAVQLAPSVQFIALSTRASIPFEEAARGLQYRDVAGFFLTGLVSHWNYLYIGLLPLVVAGFAVVAGRRSAARFWGVVALAGLLLSFGSRGGLYNLLYWLLPPFRLFRGQEHWSLVVVFSLSVLAALGADAWLGPLARRARPALRSLGWGGLVLFVASVGALVAVLLDTRAGQDQAGRLAARAVLFVLFALLSLLVVRARLAWPAARRWQGALLLAVAALDLFAVNRGLNASPPFEAYPYTSLLDPVRAESGFFRVQDDFQLPGHAGCGYGFRQVEGITPYRLAAYQAFLDRAAEPVRWQLLGVRYVVTWRQGLAGESLLPLAAAAQAPSAPGAPNDAGIAKVFRVLEPEPRRAFLVYAARSFSDEEALYAALNDPGFDPFSAGLTLDPSTLAGGPPSRPGDVRLTADEPGRVTLEVEASRPGLVVLGEAWYPGWAAQVDGAPARVLRVDGPLLAAEVPPGQHTLTFEFHSPALLWGGIVSLASLLLAAWVAFGQKPR